MIGEVKDLTGRKWEVKIDYERGKKVYIVCNGDEKKGTFDDEDNAREFADVLNSFD